MTICHQNSVNKGIKTKPRNGYYASVVGRAAVLTFAVATLSMTSLFMSSEASANRLLGKGDVKSLFQENCASCHGDKLQGGMAGSLLDDEWVTDGTDKALANAIKHGLANTAMPAMGGKLSDQEIRTLVVLIRESRYLKQQAATKSNKSKSNKGNDRFSSKHHDFSMQTVANSQQIIWAFDFLPSGDLLFTERSGNLVLVQGDKQTVIANTPKVWQQGQGGMLDVAVDPDYDKNGWIYLSYSYSENGTAGALAVARGKIKNGQWQQHQVLYQPPQDKHINRGRHFGSRFAFAGDYLYFSYGDEAHRERAQSLEWQGGKIHRIHKNGQVPKDNPFVKQADAVETIWTYGNRNPQGMAINPVTKELWSSEHGPRGGDEINVISKGLNYGWPKVSYGMNYDGSPLTMHTEMAGMESPKHYWTPSIAVAGINFYQGDKFPAWNNQLFAASLGMQELHRLKTSGSEVVEDEIILKGEGRIRDVASGPDGYLYIALNDKGQKSHRIVKLVPVK
ncbi:PQQ-dependent sugar dehydrogenase [Endozoicomonas sp. G2_1]|uniref:PQQ-dependent sugar dehydrogenase n=1 Tax=Endozoicomonas sp. G2_1 TaxID=2821091 RepID=UPI001ADA744B|nr:PQQ-dependent sugar dehydrogenase [Endozoicomonas sp. G2_1]MBO9491192.1 PQQ-dependent sugar dehydrogenase [Endozoicomonas sp. G2_1]